MASTFWRCAHHTLKKVHQNAYAVLSSRLYLKPYLNSCLKASFTACYSNCSHSEGTVFKRARHFQERTAIADNSGKFTYNNLLELSRHFGQQIIDKCTGVHDEDLQGKRVAFLCPKDVRYVAIQWAIWRYGGVAVPLSPSHPQNMLEYFITDSQSTLIVSTEQFRSRLTPLAEKLHLGYLEVPACQARSSDVGNMSHEQTAVEIKTKSWDDTGAMIFYTSGTTGKPKGVLTTHGNIRSQITDMVQAWGWTEDDRILHVLPLHHVHGVINVLSCPLWVGATCIMLEEFDSEKIWQYLTGSNLSLFMAVPTIYSKLIQFYQDRKYTKEEKENIKNKCLELRLMVSGSSALLEPTMKAWEDISGHTLLERYGMTEIGMALSNPLHGARIPGSVGKPLPSVQVRIVVKDDQNKEHDDQVLVEGDQYGSKLSSAPESIHGALQVKGPSVFKGYWGRPEATQESFTADGWFRTGDDAACSADGVYKILGRASVDIIKSGGYKISALDIERELLSHPDIRDCAVLGVPDPVWGELVAALVSLNHGKSLSLTDLRKWSEDKLSSYQTPSVLKVIDEIPRNIMGKVNKKELVKLFLDKT